MLLVLPTREIFSRLGVSISHIRFGDTMKFNSEVVRVIFDQIVYLSGKKLLTWGARYWQELDDNTLQFEVLGGRSHIRVKYVPSQDLYNLYYGFIQKDGSWICAKEISEVYWDNLVPLIDDYVESFVELMADDGWWIGQL